MSPEVPASQAALQLRVNDSRVRQLIEAGELPARKVANRWLVDVGALQRRGLLGAPQGRPLEAENAWGLLFLASGEPAPWLASDVRSRLRRRLREGALRRDHGRLMKRARVRYFIGGERARKHLMREPRFVRSGISAAADHGASLRSPRVLEGYLPEVEVARLAYRFALRSVDESEADLIVRGVAGFWPFGASRVAPKAVVAVDLLESLDQRTRRAGEELLRTIDR
jgi:hypothetical protein